MEGVTILSTDTSLFWWQEIWFFVSIGYSLHFIDYIFTEWEPIGKSDRKKMILRLVIWIALWAGLLVSKKLYPDTKYQVFISEDINISEFLEKYEIIEQNGQVLTVKSKENKT